MKVVFDRSFYKSLNRLKDSTLNKRIEQVIYTAKGTHESLLAKNGFTKTSTKGKFKADEVEVGMSRNWSLVISH